MKGSAVGPHAALSLRAVHFEGSGTGCTVLEEITEAMVGFHEHYYGRRPTTAHSQMMGDDLLACILGDMYTDVEKTLIEMERQALVHESRSAFQRAMEPRFVKVVERISGRRVEKFISTHHVGPDVEVELFVLGAATGG